VWGQAGTSLRCLPVPPNGKRCSGERASRRRSPRARHEPRDVAVHAPGVKTLQQDDAARERALGPVEQPPARHVEEREPSYRQRAGCRRPRRAGSRASLPARAAPGGFSTRPRLSARKNSTSELCEEVRGADMVCKLVHVAVVSGRLRAVEDPGQLQLPRGPTLHRSNPGKSGAKTIIVSRQASAVLRGCPVPAGSAEVGDGLGVASAGGVVSR
jgi:hypothetical protein